MEDKIRELKKTLRLRMNGVASTVMRNSGLNYKLNFGLDAISIREIANRYEPEIEFAERLWTENARECKILATLLYPKTAYSPEKADLWLKECIVPELMEQLVFNLLQHLDFSPDKALEWINSDLPETKAAGYTLLLRLIIGKKRYPDLTFALELAEKDLKSDHFRLQQSASRFVERARIL